LEVGIALVQSGHRGVRRRFPAVVWRTCNEGAPSAVGGI
jgi:hypothetical protein